MEKFLKNKKTKIRKIDSDNIEWKYLWEAGQVIREGNLVAFPTETVYGLGADALNKEAVLKIFLAKERPFLDPLIVHVQNIAEVNSLVEVFPPDAKKLSKLFWPGPLTMVFKKSKIVPNIVTSGLDTVAIRIPNHKVALALIKEAQRPIAAPSANIFSYTSPTNAQHVIADLAGRVDIILDSGKTKIGVESTVLDVTSKPFKILRLGGTTWEILREIIPDIIVASNYTGIKKSPGMLKKHYSPKAKLWLVEGKGKEMIKNIQELAQLFRSKGNKVGILSCQENYEQYPGFLVKTLGEADDLDSCAYHLYGHLRALDSAKCDIIISESFSDKGLGRAIMDRLRRAAS